MTLWRALYQLLIGPLELFFEVVYSLGNHILNNPGLSIIFLSLAMNFLVLPLYRRADTMQAEERDREVQLKPWVDHIKKTFRGDERFMMLQTYYRQNGYKQTDALKGSVSLLLEIPFFIAAYRFLSGLELLQGVSFGPINNLGAPDALLAIAGVSINLLPILMTAVNAISAAIYMKGFPLKSKVQMYGMALIFLVFLYNSPAGLVFYWTLNNVFSLLKNIFYKLKKPGLVLRALSSLVGLAGLVIILFIHPMSTMRRQILLVLALLMLEIPLPLYFLQKRNDRRSSRKEPAADEKLFLAGCLLLACLTGLLIPSAVIQSSPAEFVDIMQYHSPLWYILSAALYAVGTFVIWFGVFYRLAEENTRRFLDVGIWLLSGIAVIDYMFFGTNYGTLSPLLIYEVEPAVSMGQGLLNLAILVVMSALLYLVWRKRSGLVRGAAVVICLALVGMSAVNIAGTSRQLADIRRDIETANEEMPKIELSKTGKNVVVLMIDRAMGAFLPFLMEERPELAEQFDGFTYYPNTLSFGSNTLVGSPALFGGYDYTPEASNARSDLLNMEKQNEALKVMPVLFSQNGFEVTVCDPTYANYQWIPDLTIYDEYPEIHRYISLGKYRVGDYDSVKAGDRIRNRNFFCYSLFRAAPQLIQPTLYNHGAYNELASTGEHNEEYVATSQTMSDISHAEGLDESFMNSYAVLVNMPLFTEFTSEEENTFLLMTNDTTHQPTLLQEPGYEPAPLVNNTEYEREHEQRHAIDGRSVQIIDESDMRHYHVNMAALLQLGNWMDFLRENDVYNNTRIIIVADHGWGSVQFETDAFEPDPSTNTIAYNPLLMVKDFDSEGFAVDESFMTNADTPTLATVDLIDNPLNPFTGNPINSDEKNSEQHVLVGSSWQTDINNGYTLLPGDWWAVQPGALYDADNWSLIAEDAVLTR